MKSTSRLCSIALIPLLAVLIDASSDSLKDGDGGSSFVEYSDGDSSGEDLDSKFGYEMSWGEMTHFVGALTPLPTGSEKGFYSRVLTMTCPSRPGSLDPNSRKGAEIYLHRANDAREPVIYEAKDSYWRTQDINWLVRNGFDVNKPTLVYLGGWRMSNKAAVFKAARRSLDRMAAVRGGDAPLNLIIFDWFNYGSRNYGKSVSMVPHLGQVLGNFLEQLIDQYQYKASQLHIVSYSLSTHIAGLAARHLRDSSRGLVDQITAIDPTGVCFHRKSDQVFDKQYSLRPTDAKLVVARHYNMRQLGAGRLIGGVDIVMNGGENQPKMSTDRKNFRDLMGALLVAPRNHHRAIFHEAHKFEGAYGCQEIAYKCPTLEEFDRGQCADCGRHNESCLLISTLGNVELNLKPSAANYSPGTVMQATTGYSQYCTHNYQIVIELNPMTPRKVSKLFDEGQVKFKLNDVKIKPKFRVGSKTGGIKYTQLLKLNERIAQFPQRLGVKSASLFSSIKSISINYMSNISPQVRASNSLRYFPDVKSKRNELVASRPDD